jgi:hypothetical protein
MNENSALYLFSSGCQKKRLGALSAASCTHTVSLADTDQGFPLSGSQ